MPTKCELCGKRTAYGNKVSHANNKTRRQFKANVQRVRVKVDGGARKMNVCTTCIKSGKVTKAA
jgi:large subunit ribosomal protein L28